MVSFSPGLIAAAHVLHRLSVPRHPPCALVLLIRRTPDIDVAMEFSRSARAEVGALIEHAPSPSKLNSVRSAFVEVDVIPGEPAGPTAIAPRSVGHQGELAPTGVIAPASLERR
jgi:hypothetical protein